MLTKLKNLTRSKSSTAFKVSNLVKLDPLIHLYKCRKVRADMIGVVFFEMHACRLSKSIAVMSVSAHALLLASRRDKIAGMLIPHLIANDPSTVLESYACKPVQDGVTFLQII